MASWRVRIALAISVLNRLSEGNVEIGLGGVLDSGSERAEAWGICRMVICGGGSNSSVIAVYVSLSTVSSAGKAEMKGKNKFLAEPVSQ